MAALKLSLPQDLRLALVKARLWRAFVGLSDGHKKRLLKPFKDGQKAEIRRRGLERLLAELRDPARLKSLGAIKTGMLSSKGVRVPAALSRALRSHARAKAVFDAMRPSCQIEYSAWVAGARSPEVLARRVPRALERILEYGRRHPERGARASR